MLRLDWNLLFNVINLLILYALMQRFLFGPVKAILARRQEEADIRFEKADQKQAEADQSKAEYESFLRNAETEKEQILMEARKKASGESAQIIADAKQGAELILEKARKDAVDEKEAVLEQAEGQIREMVVTAAARIAAKKDTAATDLELYDKFLAEAKV